MEFPIFSGDGLALMQFGVLLASLLHHVYLHAVLDHALNALVVPLAIDLAVAEGHT